MKISNLILAGLLCLPLNALASTVTFSWDITLTREDGTAVTEFDISGSTVYCSTSAGVTKVNATSITEVPRLSDTLPLPKTVGVVFNLPAGTLLYCAASVTDKSTPQVESKLSNEISFNPNGTSPPSAPGVLRVITIIVQ